MRPTHLPRLLAGLSAGASLACGCSNGTGPGITTPPTGDVRIVANASLMTTTAFAPNPFSESFATRATVKWVNLDHGTDPYGAGVTHHLVSDTGLFDSGAMAPDASYSFTFAGPGTFAYHCSIHPGMVGSITIAP